MLVVCAYCRAALGERNPIDDPRVSHGICSECADWLQHQARGMKLSEYLDGFEVPVVIVDQDGRLVACNGQFSDMVGKNGRELFGALGGDAMECRFARLPGGCGNTIHCETCTIRRCVEQTLETGQGVRGVPASLEQDRQTIDMVISTEKIGDVVRLWVERLVPKPRSS